MNPSMNKKIWGMILVAIFALSIPFTEAGAADKAKFSFIAKDMTNPYYLRMSEGAKKAAQELGIDLTWLAAKFNGDIDGQIGLVESQIVQKPNCLILVPMNAVALVPKIRECSKLGIPVVIADTRIRKGTAEFISFVGLDEKESAMSMAQFLVKHLNSKGKIAILEGFRGSSTAEERLKGFHEVLDKESGIKIVASVSAEWDREKGLKATEDILQAHPDVNAILASNDEMALGAIQAVKTAGKLDQIAIVGDDAIPAALDALKAGELLATIDGNTDKVGYNAVQTAYNAVVKNEEVPKWVVVPSTILTKKDITPEYLKSRGIE